MKILDGMQQFIPSKKLVTRPSDPSWWTPESTAAVRAKQLSWKRFRRNPIQQNEDRYRLSSSNCAACIRQVKARESARLRWLLHSGSLPRKNGGQPSKKLAVKVATHVFPSSVMTTVRNTQLLDTSLDALDVSSQSNAALNTGTLIGQISPFSLQGVRQPSTRYAFDHHRSDVCSASWIPRRQRYQTKFPHGFSRSVQRGSLIPSPNCFHSASVVESSPMVGRLLT